MDSPHLLKARLNWVEMYLQTKNAGLTCKHCGISRPTLRKWVSRYQASGLDGLHSRSRRSHKLPDSKVTEELEKEILRLRTELNLGAKRIQGELLRDHFIRLSTRTIWKVLQVHKAPALRKPRIPKAPKRYSRPIPGDRVQVDTMKVAPSLYQFTAIDDCTRIRVLGIYTRRTAANAVLFLEERMLEEFGFPIQRIQTDRGAEFFGMRFQKTLHKHHIKFRPIRPRTPHLNGKVERSQQTDKQEFWARMDLRRASSRIEELDEELAVWQMFYNWYRPHSSLGGRTPRHHACDLLKDIPWSREVWDAYDEEKEFSQGGRVRDYELDQQLQKLKRCL